MFDNKLSEFFFLCKEKYLNLEEWILQNEWIVNSHVCKKSPTFPGYTPLHFAVKSNNLNAVKLLLKHKADFTFKNVKGQTPLHLGLHMVLLNKHKHSKWEQNLLLILDEILLAHKVNLTNAKNNVGLTHFHIACFRNIESVVLNFLKNGVDLNNSISLDSFYWAGYTPLHIAVKYSYLNVASWLLTYGANINVKDASGFSPIHYAIKKGNELFVQLFLSIIDRNDSCPLNANELSLLHVSCMAIDELDTLNILLESNKSVNISVKSDAPFWAGYTPLHVAVYYKRMYIASILIQHGADINLKDANNISAFQLAIRKKLFGSSFMSLILTKFNEKAEKPINDTKLFDLISACISNDTKLIQCLLNEGFNINSSVPQNYIINLPGYTLLHFAVELGEIEIIDLLLKNGADVCAQDVTGLSPLHLAIQNQNHNAIEKIFSFYTNMNKNPSNHDGFTHLHIASMCNKIFIVENILKHQKIVNLTTKNGDTPLHYAVKFNSKETVILLLKNKADFTVQNTSQGSTCLHLAVENKNEEIIDIILSYHGKRIINPISKFCLSHFHVLCKKNKVNLIKKFLENSVSINHAVSQKSEKFAGFTPLHFAVKYGSLETIKILLDNEADILAEDALHKISLQYVNKLKPDIVQKILNMFWSVIKDNEKFKSRFEISTLHIACMRDDFVSVEKLLKSKFSVEDCSNSNCPLWPNYSPLHFAAKYGGIKTIELLLNHNANVDSTDKYGFTPLHLVSSLHKFQIVDKLLACGANSAAKNIFNITPLRLAIQSKNQDIVKLILSHSSCKMKNAMDNKGLTYFHIACLKNSVDIVEMFLQNGVNINEQVHFFSPKYAGYTSLHIAVKLRHFEVIDLLLKYSVNVNISDVEGNTPLHLTCLPKIADVKISSTLLKHGANPGISNALGDTVTELAIKYNHINILQEILKNGADLNIKNCRALQLAINLHREQIVDELLNYGADATMKFPDGKTFFHQTILNVHADENYYYKIFMRLLKYGCDPNISDDLGRAALHNSYWPVNMPGLKALLRCGADVNVEDRSGRTVVSYFFEITTSRMPRTELYRIFRKHLETRNFMGFALSKTNEALYKTLVEQADDFLYNESNEKPNEVSCQVEVQKMKELYFGYVSLYDMLKNINLMARYLMRNEPLNEFFNSGQFEELFPQCGCVIVMQYAKALKRSNLMKQAAEAVDTLLWEKFREIRWNDECSEALIEYLNDEDLHSLGNIRRIL